MMRKPKPKAAGTWDFAGACAPKEDLTPRVTSGGMNSFTLRIFQWVAMAGGKNETTLGKVVRRVKGTPMDAKAAYDEARRICAELNAAQESRCDKTMDMFRAPDGADPATLGE